MNFLSLKDRASGRQMFSHVRRLLGHDPNDSPGRNLRKRDVRREVAGNGLRRHRGGRAILRLTGSGTNKMFASISGQAVCATYGAI
jgi:hypothetical protein